MERGHQPEHPVHPAANPNPSEADPSSTVPPTSVPASPPTSGTVSPALVPTPFALAASTAHTAAAAPHTPAQTHPHTPAAVPEVVEPHSLTHTQTTSLGPSPSHSQAHILTTLPGMSQRHSPEHSPIHNPVSYPELTRSQSPAQMQPQTPATLLGPTPSHSPQMRPHIPATLSGTIQSHLSAQTQIHTPRSHSPQIQAATFSGPIQPQFSAQAQPRNAAPSGSMQIQSPPTADATRGQTHGNGEAASLHRNSGAPRQTTLSIDDETLPGSLPGRGSPRRRGSQGLVIGNPLPPLPHEARTAEYRRLDRHTSTGQRSGIDWIVPVGDPNREKTAGERLEPTIATARIEKDKYSFKAKLTGYTLNIAIGLQVLLSALVTGLSAATAGNTSLSTAVLGGLSTLVASYLARARGSNEPELSITRVKDLEQFIRECEAFQMDYGHITGSKCDAQLDTFRRRFEELLGNANGERRLAPPV